MSEPVFVRGWHEYESYVDYWRLVELAGFSTCRLDEMRLDDPDATYIVTPLNGETQPGFPGARARIILWDLEWHEPYPTPPGIAALWASDAWYAAHIGAAFVPLGSHPDLVPVFNEPDAAVWDVCLLAYPSLRRQPFYHALQERGLSLAPNGWGAARNHVLRHSRAMVHVHQHDAFPCIPAQRFALAASARIALVSEACTDPTPFVAGMDFISVPARELPDAVARVVRGRHTRALAYNLHERACVEFPFRLNVLNALEGVLCAS